MSKAHVRLVLIVRNESKIIERCLRAAKPVIESWCIVDTGSTDNTKELVLGSLEGIPGRLLERPWRNFSANRQESFELARRDAPPGTYCLLLDADHELVTHAPLPELTLAGYHLPQRDAALVYDNVRLIRCDADWRCIGVTHEVWTPPDGADTAALRCWEILDHCDGGTRSEKYQRDKRLLLQGLKDEPNNERYKFYLAQTYQDLGDWGNAIHWYRERASCKGFEEERWVARLRLGRCLLSKHERSDPKLDADEANGVRELLRAIEERPTRAEPYWSLASHFRARGDNRLAYMFAKRGSEIPEPSNEKMFVEWPVYDRGLLEEISITAWHVGNRDEAFQATEDLLATPSGSAVAAQNLPFFAKKLDGSRGSFGVAHSLRTFNDVLYHCSNPSVCMDLDGKPSIINTRLVNYEQEKGRRYWGRPVADRIDTKNAISTDGGRTFKLLDSSILNSWPEARITGLEDIRLVRHGDEVWLTATCCQVPEANGNPQVVLGRLSSDLCRVEHLVPIKFRGAGPVEKNWVLWPQSNGTFRCIYSFSPLTIIDLDPETGVVTKLEKGPLWSYPGRLRGSAGPVELPDGTLFVVHDVARQADQNVYTHRFVLLDGNELHVSDPYLLDHFGIEYCAGAALDGDELLLTYGFEDREARWLRIPLAEIVASEVAHAA